MIFILLFFIIGFNTTFINAEIPGANFLDIEIGASASALGYAFTAGKPDSTAIYWNPATLLEAKRKNFGISTSFFYAGIFHTFGGYIHPLNNNKIGFGVIFLDSGEIPVTESEPSNPEKKSENSFTSFRLTDFAIMFSFAKHIFKIPLGITFKFVSEKLYNVGAKGFGSDIGTRLKVSKKPEIKLGFCMRNLGYIKPENSNSVYLPLSFNLGLSLKYLNYLILTEVKYPLYGDTIFKFGIEYQYDLSTKLVIYPRIGYTTFNRIGLYSQNKDYLIDSLNGFTFGSGVYYKFLSEKELNIDYVILPHTDLENVHKISLNLSF